jgi:predicted ATPase
LPPASTCSPDERQLLEQASIEAGFHVGGLVALSQPEAVASMLEGLVHKELIRSERPQIPGQQAFRFRHALIRDAAYEAIPKEIRSDLHERHADWLEQALGAGSVRLQILGCHLEQAYEYRAGSARPTKAFELADRALRLASAGRAAFRRRHQAAINLLSAPLRLATGGPGSARPASVMRCSTPRVRRAGPSDDAIGRAGSVGDPLGCTA